MTTSPDYNSHILFDMRQLADRVRTIPADRFQHIAPLVMALKLMRTNWIVHAGVAALRWRYKLTDAQSWGFLARKVPTLFENLQENLVSHIETGRDKTDKRSAGGLCQDEVNLLLAVLRAEERSRG